MSNVKREIWRKRKYLCEIGKLGRSKVRSLKSFAILWLEVMRYNMNKIWIDSWRRLSKSLLCSNILALRNETPCIIHLKEIGIISQRDVKMNLDLIIILFIIYYYYLLILWICYYAMLPVGAIGMRRAYDFVAACLGRRRTSQCCFLLATECSNPIPRTPTGEDLR